MMTTRSCKYTLPLVMAFGGPFVSSRIRILSADPKLKQKHRSLQLPPEMFQLIDPFCVAEDPLPGNDPEIFRLTDQEE
jgi:hypothetical protein